MKPKALKLSEVPGALELLCGEVDRVESAIRAEGARAMNPG